LAPYWNEVFFFTDTPLYILCLLIFLFNLMYPYNYIYSGCMSFGDGFPSGSPQIKDSGGKGNQSDYSTAQQAKKGSKTNDGESIYRADWAKWCKPMKMANERVQRYDVPLSQTATSGVSICH